MSMSRDAAQSRRSPYYGWWLVAFSAIFHGLFGGLYHTGIAVYFLPLTRTFGISRAKMSLAFSLNTLEGGIEGPLAGYLVDRFGPRIVIIVGVLMGGVGFLLMAATQSYAAFLVVFLGLLTIGLSAPFHGLAASINLWFRRRLGLAMSLASAGSAIGGFLLTPAVAWVVLTQGWRLAAIMSGMLLLVVGLPLAFSIRRPAPGEAARDEHPIPASPANPEALGPVEGATGTRGTARATFSRVDFTISEALHTRTYWLLSVAIGLRLMAQSALMVHMVPILVSRGVSESMAATLVAVMSLMRLPAMIGAGFWADLWSRTRVSAVFMVTGVLAAMIVVWGPNGLITGLMFAILFAAAQACNSITWALVGQFFGRANFGSLRGGVTLIQSLMSTGGPLAAGWVFDRTGSYAIALIGTGVIYAVSAVLFWGLKAPVRAERPAASVSFAHPSSDG